MDLVREYIQGSLPLAWVALVAAFAVLARCADLFVDSAVRLAARLKIPELVIGIVLVSLATTAPELSVSLMSAIRGFPEMALGNAIGSVVCDDGLALGLAGVLAVAPIAIIPAVLKTAGIFLVAVSLLAFAFVLPDGTLSRSEGCILLALFCGYVAHLFVLHRSGKLEQPLDPEQSARAKDAGIPILFGLFLAALAGILLASEFVITCASTIAEKQFHVPQTVIALTLVAFGTSVPEVATCVVAVRKKAGAIAVGNILGADIMNICWVAGASAIANDLTVGRKEILFMFPAMFAIVGAMLLMLSRNYTLTRAKGAALLALYVLYLVALFIVFPPSSGPAP